MQVKDDEQKRLRYVRWDCAGHMRICIVCVCACVCASAFMWFGGGERDREIKKAQSCRGPRWRPVREKRSCQPVGAGRVARSPAVVSE